MLTALKRLSKQLSVRRKWQLLGIIVLMLVSGAAEMATLGSLVPVLALLADPASAVQYPQMQFLLRHTGAEPDTLLRWTVGAFIAIAMAGAGVRMALFWVKFRFSFGLGGDIGREVYSRTLHRSYSWHVTRNSSEILAAIEKVNSVTNNVIVQLTQGGVALVVALAILVSLLLIDAQTALVAGSAFLLLYGLTMMITQRRLRRNAKRIAGNRTNRVRAVQEGLGGIRDVLLDGTQSVYVGRFVGHDRGMRHAQASNAFIGASPRVIMEAAGVVLILLLAFILSGKEGGLAQAVPTLGALALGAQKLLPQMQLAYVARSAISGSQGELEDVLDLLEAPVAPQFKALPAPAGQLQPTAAHRPGRPLIAIRGLGFRYHADGPEVLRTVDLEIPRGIRIGFVGTTGSGKSTLIDLVLGLLDPCEGVIEIEGNPLTPHNLRAWQNRIAHVPQTIHLVDASIAENIALGTLPDQIDWPRLESAARTAQLDAFVVGLDDGYQTTVGERGVRLSGGQRQRIGLARALYKPADVLVLDEATSALDNRTEEQVMTALNDLHRDKTVLMIAHRLSTIQNCDRIVVISNGVIAGSGDWSTLMASNPIFRRIASAAAADSAIETETAA